MSLDENKANMNHQPIGMMRNGVINNCENLNKIHPCIIIIVISIIIMIMIIIVVIIIIIISIIIIIVSIIFIIPSMYPSIVTLELCMTKL